MSGEKQRIDRGYDFPEVLDWFAEHVDVIVLMFDAHKLDISDEFKSVIEVVRKYKEKVRIVLNKADQVCYNFILFTKSFQTTVLISLTLRSYCAYLELSCGLWAK